MDKEEILKMTAGNELDVLVATKVMGKTFPTVEEMKSIANEQWKEQEYCLHFTRGFDAWKVGGEFKWKYNPVSYSTDISKVWEVEEKFKDTRLQEEYAIQLHNVLGLMLHEPTTLNNIYQFAHATPVQRCKAALLAVMD